MAGLKAIDAEQYDAAAVDGANAWRRFLHVTLPGMRYVIIVATLLSTIFTFNSFTLTYLLTGGGPGGATRIYTILAYEYAVSGLRYGAGIAVAMTTAPFLFLLILFLGRYMMQRGDVGRREEDDGRRLADRDGRALAGPAARCAASLVVFWAVNDAVETVLGAAVATRSGRRARRRCCAAGASRAGRRTHPVRAARGDPALRAAAVLLHLRHGVQDASSRSSRSRACSGRALDAGQLPLHALREAVPDLVRATPSSWPLVSTSSRCWRPALGALRAGAAEVARRRTRMGTIVLIAYLMPAALMFIPLYCILVQLRLTNTLTALMVTYPTFLLPFATWLMMGYYRSIPEELEDAAMIDGCNRFQAFFRVVLPLVRPALLAVAHVRLHPGLERVPVRLHVHSAARRSSPCRWGCQGMIIGDIQPWGELMAASLMTAMPVVIIYMLGQKLMVAGLTAGSVKG